jgi:hypothetical protein
MLVNATCRQESLDACKRYVQTGVTICFSTLIAEKSRWMHLNAKCKQKSLDACKR